MTARTERRKSLFDDGIKQGIGDGSRIGSDSECNSERKTTFDEGTSERGQVTGAGMTVTARTERRGELV